MDVAGEGVDGADGIGDAAAPLFRQLAGFGGGVRGLIRMGGHFANGADHLAHGAGQLFDLGELFVDRFVGLFHAKGHLGGDVVELLAGGALVAKYLFEVLLRVGDCLGDVTEFVTRLEQYLVAEVPLGEALQQAHQIVHLLDHQAGAGEQQDHEQQPHDGGLHQTGPEQAIGDRIRLGGIEPFAEQGRFQIVGVKPEFCQ